MRGIIKKLLIFSGLCFIAAPFVLPLLTKTAPSPLTTLTTSRSAKSPYPPSTYVSQTQQLHTQAKTASDPKQTARLLKNALDTVNEGLMLYSDSAALVGLRGTIYEDLIGTVPDAQLFAMSDFAKAFSLDPNQSDFAKKGAAVAVHFQEYDRAITLLQQAHDLQPSDPEILMDLATAHSKAGQLEQAIASFTKLLSLLPSGTESKTIRSERDALIRLIASDPATGSARRPSQASNIGGFAVAGSTTIPDEVTLQETNNDNPYTINEESFSGDGILTAGTKTVTVINTHVTPTTAVYVTATSPSNNAVLYISSKTTGSFTVATDTVFDHDVSFKWWIR